MHRPAREGCALRPPLRVFHTADVHLGSDAYGSVEEQAGHRDRERRIFQRIVDRALTDRVDLLLIAGDLFDHNRVPDETVEFVRTELDLIVWGRAMEEHEPAFQPLGGIPGRGDRRWCLAMGHGFFYEERQRPERSSPIFADEVRDTGWDYVALGHHHLQANVSQDRVTAYYAGAPGTVLYVDFSDDGIRVEPRPLD